LTVRGALLPVQTLGAAPVINSKDLTTQDFDMFQSKMNDRKRNSPPNKGSITHSSANTELIESTCRILKPSTLMDVFRGKGCSPHEEHDSLDTLPKQDQQ
jgi:hypothetical protein